MKTRWNGKNNRIHVWVINGRSVVSIAPDTAIATAERIGFGFLPAGVATDDVVLE